MEPNEIIPGLFIGNMHAAKDANFFKRENIGAVLNCTPDVPHYFSHMSGAVEYMRINVNDSLQTIDFQKMTAYMPCGVQFIHKNLDLDKKRVFVHCHAGVQRSAAMVAAYLMYKFNISVEKAVNHIMRQRPVAFMFGKSVNFKSSLLNYSKNLRR
jgi:protein-tyrosine phosphatase